MRFVRRNNQTGRKGTTLAELCVVLALVAIVSTMVVSFSLLMSQRVTLSTTRLNVMNDLESVDAIAEGWLGQMKLLGAELSLQTHENTGRKWIQAKKDAQTYTLSFDEEEKMLKGTLPDGEDMVFAPTAVRGIEFDQVENWNKTDRLFFYTVIYNLPGADGSNGQQTQTFCANPRVGETYGNAAGAGAGTGNENTPDGEE